jgi:YHS domain-containing protein
VGNRKQAEHWIPIYADWVRKLQVGVYLRTGRLSEFHRMKARLLEDRLELLEHELADNDREAVHDLIGLIARAERRLRIAFLSQSEPAPQSADRAKAVPMPEGAKADEERTLYLTAKGKYTDADIAANGRMTASEKYKEFHSSHDFNPKLGEPICPVTHTKANAECSWIVGGKRYLFCCPPCIDEFVRMAKESPDKIQEPAAYVSR